MMLKALSVLQPWAWLIVNAHKPVENRGWYLNHRGLLVIHAGVRIGREQMDDWERVRDEFPDIPMPPLRDMHAGGIVGTVEVYGVVTSAAQCTVEQRPWYTGPYGILMRDPQLCRFVPFKGQQKQFSVPAAQVVNV